MKIIVAPMGVLNLITGYNRWYGDKTYEFYKNGTMIIIKRKNPKTRRIDIRGILTAGKKRPIMSMYPRPGIIELVHDQNGNSLGTWTIIDHIIFKKENIKVISKYTKKNTITIFCFH